ncbi:MAG: alpha/beta hydrolase [Candidatus Atabeyarchaeum deiterrae]
MLTPASEIIKEEREELNSIIVSGIRTSIQSEGVGQTPIVLVHGAAYNHTLWRKQMPVLSSLSKTMAVDLPGHGESATFAAGQLVSVKSYTDHIHTILSMLSASTTILVGHSMGGAISMRFALDYPDKVKALVLIGTGAKLGVNPAIIEGLSKNFKQAIRTGVAAWSYAQKTDRSIIQEGINEMVKCKQEVAIADFKACNDFDIREHVSQIGLPTLIIVGDEDKLTPVKWSEYLRKNIRNSQLKVISGAGHMIMHEKPDEVDECIGTFVKNTIKVKKT